MKGLQQWSDPVAEGIPAAARGRDPQSQPLKAATIARVFRPLVRRMMAGLDLVQGDLEHQIGPMGLGAHAEIGGEQESQIELIDRLVDGAGAMVGGQGVLDREPLGGPRIPGRHGEAIEFGTVLGWRRVDRYREVERAARPVERAMVLRSRWEYHSSRAPFEGAGYPFAILRRGSPYSLYPLEPAESGTISIARGIAFLSLSDLIRSKETEREGDWADVSLLEEIQDARQLAQAAVKTEPALALRGLRSRRGFERALGLGLMNDQKALEQSVRQCEYPLSFAFLLPFIREAEQPASLRLPVDEAYLSLLRTVEPGGPKHAALVEVVRRAYKRWAMEVDRRDKESRSHRG